MRVELLIRTDSEGHHDWSVSSSLELLDRLLGLRRPDRIRLVVLRQGNYPFLAMRDDSFRPPSALPIVPEQLTDPERVEELAVAIWEKVEGLTNPNGAGTRENAS